MDFRRKKRNFERRVKYQIVQIRTGGKTVVLKKLVSVLLRVAYWCVIIAVFPLFILIVLSVRIISRHYLIRFGYFSADRIGHLAFDIEYYLTYVRNPSSWRGVDLFFLQGNLCNEQLGIMLKRKVFVHNIVRVAYYINKYCPGSHIHSVVPARVLNGSRDLTGKFASSDPNLCFTKSENTRGNRYLESLEMKPGARFVCLVVRDSSYLDEYYVSSQKWNYHSYRDSNLESYRDAAIRLANEGCWVFRMGKSVRERCEFSHNRIIDYANSPDRDDFLDIWLMANCYFSISTSTGLDAVADVFRRPIVFVNFLPLSHFQTWCRTVLVPKTLRWSGGSEPKLTLNEHLRHNYQRSIDYETTGIRIEDLTSLEISDAVMEMYQRINGLWPETNLSKDRQKMFWDSFSSWEGFPDLHQWIHPEARIGEKYLEASPELLQ